jgi:type 2 lantibiotic biosynthesis protein LanM
MDPRFTSPTWYRALTLAERSALPPGSLASLPPRDANPEIGRRRIERWRSQPPYDSEQTLAQRLAQIGIDQVHLEQILGESAESLQRRVSQPPAWLAELAEAYAQPASAYADPPPGEEVLGFLELVQPLVDRACERVAAGIADLAAQWSTLPFDPATIEDVLLMNLPDPLLARLGRTMVLELNVARLQELLEGDTPAERFRSFVQGLRQPDQAIVILSEYPVLARQLAVCINRWAEVSLEFLGRLCEDWEAIRACFSPAGDPGVLVELAGGAGDTHRGGRSVMVAQFESGFRIVYKPKPLSIDVHFQELLTWLNGFSYGPPFRILTVVDRGPYGWVEFVEHTGCSTTAEITRFYHRLGAYLALLNALNATDFHLENLIAAGEHPVLIDLETLFHPEFDPYDRAEAGVVAARQMADSVLQVGLLPQRLWSAEDYTGIDISGLGGEAGQLSPDRVPRLADTGTDEMRYVRERIELPGEANRPTLDGVEVNALDHVEELLDGFSAMYRLLVEHRAELLDPDGPLARFAEDEIRVLLRPTRTYDQLLFESFHPDMLRDALDRDLLLDRLWVIVSQRPFMTNALTAERAELEEGDIPIFTTHPSSLDLWSGRGDVIPGVLTESGSSLLDRRLRQLGEQDLQRQIWTIRSSLATLATAEVDLDGPSVPAYRLRQSRNGAHRARLLAGARSAAESLAATAVLGEQDVAWLGLVRVDDRTWELMPLGMDLYNGIPGVALFLAYAGLILGEERYTALSRRGFHAMSRHVELLGEELPGIGSFEGWGGILYALTHLGALWQDAAVLEKAAEVVNVLASFVEQDDDYGVVRGAAGAIGSLLTYHRCVPSSQALEAAVACGDHLIASAQTIGSGLGWVASGSGPAPLGGFGHGAAGIAWALLELAAATGHGPYQAAAQQAIAYERSLFRPDAGNWLDLRWTNASEADRAGGPPRFSTAWCHGAPGIGLARLAARKHLHDQQLDHEINVALHTTLAQGFGQSHSLCHGDFGNLELLMQASRVLGEGRWRVEADRLVAMVLDSIDRDGWQCGGPQSVEIPGLMLGIAGIGYQMLRLAEPDSVPSVLLLAPPRL